MAREGWGLELKLALPSSHSSSMHIISGDSRRRRCRKRSSCNSIRHPTEAYGDCDADSSSSAKHCSCGGR